MDSSLTPSFLGAFQPFYRNHAELSTIQQEFYQWPSVAVAARKAIATRYQLLDYIYTSLYYQSSTGAPMINPLFFLYPADPATFAIQEQWFLGDALLISPVTTDYSDTVTFYLPQDVWYDFWTHERVESEGKNVTKSGLGTDEIPVHVRGGTIIPLRASSANTTAALRRQEFTVLVAPAADGTASGRLYLDEGEKIQQDAVSEIEFRFEAGKLSVSGDFNYEGSGGESVTVGKVVVLGQTEEGTMGVFDKGKGEVVVEGKWGLDKKWEVQL